MEGNWELNSERPASSALEIASLKGEQGSGGPGQWEAISLIKTPRSWKNDTVDIWIPEDGL